MARLATLGAVALVLLLVAPAMQVGAWHQGHRHWSTIPDGPYAVVYPSGAQSFTVSDGIDISYAVFMPSVAAGVRVPVILTAGPYFGLLEEPVTLPSTSRMSGFLVDNFVSHGYAVVAASTRGTGDSGGCMELMSEREARDLDELVTFLATEPWSDGNVAMIGKSYDGGTPWMVAQFGNPHLKTIVPMQGVSDVGDLLVHHGVPQFRTPVFHNVVYWPFGFGTDQGASTHSDRSLENRAANAVCPEVAEGTAAAVWATYTGDITTTPGVKEYWAERAWREETIANYEGSIFIVHSLQDFNVVPHMVVPVFDALPQEKKLLMGQWAHHYPDEGARAQHAAYTPRMDFASMLKKWFDRELKGLSVDVGPVIEVADARTGQWRTGSEWPGTPDAMKHWTLSANRRLVEDGEPATLRNIAASPAGVATGGTCQRANAATFMSDPQTESWLYRGVGSVTVRLEPATHANVVAVLCVDGGRIVAHGATNTLYADATNTPQPFVPGLPLDVKIEFEAVERTIAAGERLYLAVQVEDYVSGGTGGDYWPGTSPGVIVVAAGEMTLPVGPS